MKKVLNILEKIFNTLGACVTPVVPALIGAGMLKVVLILLGPSVFGILQETDSTYLVLAFVADAGYYFLPIYTAIAAAEHFGTNKYLAALMGAVLISPTFVELVESGINLTIFNLPIASISYGNQILPSVVIVCIESYVYKFVDSLISEKIKNIVVPLFTVVIMVPIIFCAIGPLGALLSDALTKVILALCNFGPLGVALYTALLPFIVMFGMGGANLTVVLAMASQGPDPICFYGSVIYNCVLGCAVLGYHLRKKDAESLALGITALVGGVSEPAIFGIAINEKKVLAANIVGGFVGGLLMGIFKVKSFAMASFGIFGIITTIGEGSSILLAAISMLAGCAIAFIIGFMPQKKH